MNNLFSVKLEINSAILVNGESDQWDIDAYVVDNNGVYYASDVVTGDVVYNDATWLNMNILRYVVVSVDPMTSGIQLYARIKWDMFSQDIVEPLAGFPSMIARPVVGSVPVPSFSIQQIDESFLNNVRNYESILMSQYSWMNRIYNVTLSGLYDGINTDYTVGSSFIPSTVKVSLFGQELTDTVDYDLIGYDTIRMKEPLPEGALLKVDCNRLLY